MELAPIAFFIYNRPWHTEQSLNALAMNDFADQSVIYVFADGPKHNASAEDLRKIELTRQVVRDNTSFKQVILIASDNNKGCSNSIEHGIQFVLDKHGKIIVVEDDIVTGKGFLKYMNEAMELYHDNESVAAIHAFNEPVRFRNTADTFFLKGVQTWGWGTWKRTWDLYIPDAAFLLNELERKDLIQSFNMDGALDFTNILRLFAANKVEAWDVILHASVFLNNKFTLNPKISLVTNIGLDGSGTHGDRGNSVPYTDYCDVYPIPVRENKSTLKDIKAFYIPSLQSRIIKRLKRIIHPNG